MQEFNIILNCDEDVSLSEEELKQMIEETFLRSRTIDEVIQEKEAEFQEINEQYECLRKIFKETVRIEKESMKKLRITSILMSIYKTLATVANPNISKEEFDNIKRLIKSNIEESKKDLILISQIEEKFRKLTKYNTLETMGTMADLMTLLVDKTNATEANIVSKINTLTARIKGFNVIESEREEKKQEEKREEVDAVVLKLGMKKS